MCQIGMCSYDSVKIASLMVVGGVIILVKISVRYIVVY